MPAPPIVYESEITPEEAAVGFAVEPVETPDGPTPTVPVAALSWGDPSHRLLKTRGRDNEIVFQLQAFGRPRKGPGAVCWRAERFWPGRYGIGWVLARLHEYVDHPQYQALFELAVPAAAGTGDPNVCRPPQPTAVASR